LNPKSRTTIDPPTVNGLMLLKVERDKQWDNRLLDRNFALLKSISTSKISSVLSNNGRRGIPFFLLTQRGKSKIGDLTENELESLRTHIEGYKWTKLRNIIGLGPFNGESNINDCILINNKFKKLIECTSKEIRGSISQKKPITSFKIGLNLNPNQSLSWLYKLNKLSSVQHKNVLLRIAHGEVYTQERLARFGLADDVSCPRCDRAEDLEHKFLGCQYVSMMWEKLGRAFNLDPNLNQIEVIMGVHCEAELLCVHAEILKRILYLPRANEYLFHPRTFIKMAIKHLIAREKSDIVKQSLQELQEKIR